MKQEEIIERKEFKKRLTELGYKLSGEDFNLAFSAYKELRGYNGN